MLEKETALKLAGSLASSYYIEWVNYFEKVLRFTRSKQNKSDRKKLLGIQVKLSKIETDFWNLLREGRQKASLIKTKESITAEEQKELSGLEEQIFIHEQLIRISRTICDGIAWRNLNYNRTLINSAARGFGAGSVDANSKEFYSEFIWAYRISEHFKSVVLINDLTKFLRIGDITEIQNKNVFFHEIKKYGKRIKDVKNIFTVKNLKGNAKISAQVKRLLELQRIAFKNEAKIGDTTVRTRNFSTVEKTHLNVIKKMLKQSEKDIVVTVNIERFLEVEVTNYDALSKEPSRVEKVKSKTNKPGSGLYLVHSKWDSYYTDNQGNFLRSIPPYSIFPFSNHDCIRMMSGHYMVKSILCVDKLKQELVKRGWEIEETTEQQIDQSLIDSESKKNTMFSTTEKLYGSVPSDFALFIIKKGPFSFPLEASVYSRLTMEFLTFDTFINLLDEMYMVASQRKSDDIYFPVFKNDSIIWN